MSTVTDDVGDQAYRMYCKCRNGHISCFEEFEQKIANSTETSELIWKGYYGSALFYSNSIPFHKQKSKLIFELLFPIMKTVEKDDECNPHILYLLGWCYNNGEGVIQNNKEAVRLFQLATEQGLAIAQSNLGICYDDGDGVPQDQVMAAKLYRLAANQGHASAQYNLGLAYEKGSGVTQSKNEAATLFNMAAEQGLPIAKNALAWCYVTGQGRSRSYEKAVELLNDAALIQNLPAAQVSLARLYEYGCGVKRDLGEAFRLLQLAADQDYSIAYFYAAGYFARPDFHLTDVVKAVTLYKKALRMGVKEAEGKIDQLKQAYKVAMWNNRKAFLLFLSHYQFIYRARGSEQAEDIMHQAEPDCIHTVFYMEEMRRVITSFL